MLKSKQRLAQEALRERHVELCKAPVENKTAIRLLENKVITDNLKLVRKLVDKLVRRLTTAWDEEDDDLFQAGCVGLLIAWRRWEPNKGALSTYAMHWIRHEVQDALGDGQPIYKPKQSGKPWSVYKAQERFRAQHGREPTAEELGVTEELYERWRESPIVRSIDDAVFDMQRPSSDRSDEGSCLTLHELVFDPTPGPDKQIDSSEMAERLAEAFMQLSDKQAYVIDQLFVEGAPAKYIAEELGVTDHRVLQISRQALKKLRMAIESDVVDKVGTVK